MTLTARIRVAFVAITAMLVVLAIAVVYFQRSQMIEQLDDQLESAAPLNRPAPPFGSEPPVDPRPPAQEPPDQPISDVFIATVLEDGSVEVAVQGQLLETAPDLAALDVGEQRIIDTVGSEDGSTRFRVLAERDDQGVVRVIALSMTDVEDTVRGLVVAFLIVGVLILATLVATGFAILRLGLRPISQVTDAAQAITAGERDRRAPELGSSTEAGRLAESFNLMLDQRDRAEDKLRQFVSDASHELRTPLTSIRGYLDLYQAGAFDDREQLDDVVRRMRDESARMSGLVETLLQLARLDEQQGLDLAPTDLGGLVRDVVSNARVAHADRSIEAIGGDGELVVDIDGPKVRQLLAGMVDNALVHAPDASVRVRVEHDATTARVIVVDDGPGMRTDEAAQVFDRFYRSDDSRARSSGGSGLGLAIAKSIAEIHHGTIELETSPGQGCIFTVSLPRSPASTLTEGPALRTDRRHMIDDVVEVDESDEAGERER